MSGRTATPAARDEAGQASRTTAVAAVALIIAGLVLRVLGAWWYRDDMNPDYGIVGLMVKHIVEGRGIPVFFYGQPYMGSLEPLVSAAIARIAGVSGLTVCLGTAIVGFLLLPTVYLWARRATGAAAAVAALAFCVVGPAGYFQYMVSPRGGYAVVLVAGACILWRVACMAARESSGTPVSSVQYAVVGLVTGLAWWSTQLIAPAIATAAIVYTLACGRASFSRRSAWALPAFLLGSSPFWAWNAFHDWETFRYMTGMGGTGFLNGLDLWAEERLPHLLGTRDLPHRLRSGLEIVYALLLLCAVSETAVCCRRQGWRSAPSLCLLSLWIFIALSCGIAATSFFITLNTSRYLLPLVPVFAVVLAAGTRFLSRFLPWGIGFIPVAVLIAHQLWYLPSHVKRAELNAALQPRIMELDASLADTDVKTIYAPFAQHTLNFHMGESYCFTDMKWERYAPYARQAEFDQRPGFLNNYGLIRHFLEATGTTCSYGGATHLGVCFDCIPPAPAASVPPALWAVTNTEDAVEIRFTKPTEVSGLRLLSLSGELPEAIDISVSETDSPEWRQLPLPQTCTGFFWSGTRPYWRGRSPRVERRFPVQTINRLRVRVTPQPGAPITAEQLTMFAPSQAPVRDVAKGFPKLMVAIDTHRVQRVYSDRWLANRIRATMGPKITAFIEPQLGQGEQEGALPSSICFTPQTALVVEQGEADATRATLARAGIAMAERAVAPWVLFHFTDETPYAPGYGNISGLRWAGPLPVSF